MINLSPYLKTIYINGEIRKVTIGKIVNKKGEQYRYVKDPILKQAFWIDSNNKVCNDPTGQ